MGARRKTVTARMGVLAAKRPKHLAAGVSPQIPAPQNTRAAKRRQQLAKVQDVAVEMACLLAPLRGLVPFSGLNSAGFRPRPRAAVAARLKMTARYGVGIPYRLLSHHGIRTARKMHAKSSPDPRIKTNFSTSLPGGPLSGFLNRHWRARMANWRRQSD